MVAAVFLVAAFLFLVGWVSCYSCAALHGQGGGVCVCGVGMCEVAILFIIVLF